VALEPFETAFGTPADSPGFLIWQITNLWQRGQRAALKDLGLTHVQFVLLAVLTWLTHAEYPEGLSQVQLAQHAQVDVMMTSQVVRALVAKGLLDSTQHPRDARANLLRVTDNGRAIVGPAIQRVEAADRAFFAPLGEDLLGFVEHLQRLLAHDLQSQDAGTHAASAKPRAATETAGPIYQLKVTLQEIKPPIWRRILVRATTTLPRLHDILQVSMGWTDSHLHRFIVGESEYGQPDPDFEDDMRSEQRVPLARIVASEKASFGYEYDFGDSWNHLIVLEKILPADPALHYPHCVAGKRACPPEDVGGVWGFAELLAAVRNSKHPEHDEMLEWAGGAFDPEAFSLDAINRALAKLR
jgi:DNA-binding MarR family transcriptional regulator